MRIYGQKDNQKEVRFKDKIESKAQEYETQFSSNGQSKFGWQ